MEKNKNKNQRFTHVAHCSSEIATDVMGVADKLGVTQPSG